jgi:hypothetical protein
MGFFGWLIGALLFIGAIAMIVCGSLRLADRNFPEMGRGAAIALVVIGVILLLIFWTPPRYIV